MAETKGYVYLVKEIGIRYFLRDAIHQGVSLDEASVTRVRKMMAIFSPNCPGKKSFIFARKNNELMSKYCDRMSRYVLL